jgi:60 kDa SS-A/Ro ribonucleoprotein
MANYLKHFAGLFTPQKEKARADQAMNNAGGFTFTLDNWARLDRWLILGCEGGSYYASEQKMTIDNAKTITACLAEDGLRTVRRIAEISEAGRAPKNEPAIFALAMAAGSSDPETRKAALAALPVVCRTGTHLFHFARDVEGFRKWGRGLRTAVASWYNEKPADRVAYQAVKFQQRDGFSHRDLLRLSHPKAASAQHNAIYRWIVGGTEALSRESEKGGAVSYGDLPELIKGFERARAAKDVKELCSLIREHRLTHEMILSEWKNHVEVWDALLADMPITAMIRSLAKMTSVGLLKPMGDATRKVVSTLSDEGRIRKARVHPIAILSALKVYEQGHGQKGSLTWAPVREIIDALNDAFYTSFKAIEPTGKRHLLALDVSGSMTCGEIAGVPGLTPRVASSAMAMVTARTESNYGVVGFTSGSGVSGGVSGISTLDVSPRQRLDDVLKKVDGLPFGGTDCSLPMIWAQANKIEVDTFVVYTDSETWAGSIHPFQALREYRQKMGRAAKLIVVGMTATKFTIADPNDAGMMDVVGFDTAAPQVMADFTRAS